jgi:putative ABC transport system permease protein
MSGVIHDLRYAFRLLKKSKGFTLAAVLTLALGIGANTAVFSIVRGALLRPLPYRDPNRLVDILDQSLRDKRQNRLFAIYRDFREYKQHARSFDELAAATWAVKPDILSGRGAARGVTAFPVSDSFFDLLGAQPALGRTFTAADTTRGCSVVLSNAFWTSEFNADPLIAGRTIDLDHQSCVVLGVMPKNFAFYPAAAQLWKLITPAWPDVDNLPVVSFGRLKPDVTIAQAQAEMAALHAGARATNHERDLGPSVNNLQEQFTWLAGRNLRSTLWILLGAVALVLTIACVNVATLLLGRSLARGRELAVRAALGGGRARLFRQLITEGALLAVLGGAAGVWLASGAVRYFRSVNPVELPVGAEVSIDLPVLTFALAVSVLTALLAGLAPAWSASRADLNEALKTGGRGTIAGGRQTLSRAFVMAEIALSVVLLAGAGLLMESVLRMASTNLGFVPERLLTAGLTLPEDRYREPAARMRFYDELPRRITRLPGVAAAAVSSILPPAAGGMTGIAIFGQALGAESARLDVAQQSIGPAYFDVMGTRLIRGRSFDARDRKDSESVAIIDETLAREYFANEDPIGRRIRAGDERQPWLTIVGVAVTEMRTTVYEEMKWAAMPTVFRPLAQSAPLSARLVIRAAGEDLPLGPAVQGAVAALDSGVPVGKPEWMRESLAAPLAYPRFRAIVLGGFAAFALLLAAIGLHGVLAQLVSQRAPEIGVRIALGARPAEVVRFVARQGGAPVLAGMAAGVAASLVLGRYLSGMLYSLRPYDPLTLAAVCAALLTAAALATALPARRAARTDPIAALRQE